MNASGSNDTASAKDPYFGVFFRLKTDRSPIGFIGGSNLAVSFHIIQAQNPKGERMGVMGELLQLEPDLGGNDGENCESIRGIGGQAIDRAWAASGGHGAGAATIR